MTEREELARLYADHFGEDVRDLHDLDYELFDKILAGWRRVGAVDDAVERAAQAMRETAQTVSRYQDGEIVEGNLYDLARAALGAALTQDTSQTPEPPTSTLPTHVQHLVSGDVGKVLEQRAEGYTADFGAGPEYVKSLDVRPVSSQTGDQP